MLSNRMAEQTPQANIQFGSKTLIVAEEKVIVKYILEWDVRGFLP